MSPEHFTVPHYDDLDARADIYSLGIILYELLHPRCRPPFSGSTVRLKDLHMSVPAPTLSDAGEGFESVISRCLEKDPDCRYQNVWDLIEDLEKGSCSKLGLAGDQTGATYADQNKLEQIWEQIGSCFSNNDFREAYRLTEEVLHLDPDNIQAIQLIEEFKNRSEQARQFYQEIDQNLDGGNLFELTALLIEACSIYPDHPAGRMVQIKFASRVKEYRKAIDQGLIALKSARWESAHDLFCRALSFHSGASHLKRIIDPLSVIKNARQQINEALIKKNFTDAKHLARLVDLRAEQLKSQVHTLRASRRG